MPALTIKTKLILLFVVSVLITLGVIAFNFLAFTRIRTESRAADLVAEQRIRLFMINHLAGQAALAGRDSAARHEIAGVVAQIEAVLRGLEKGDAALGLSPPSDPALVEQVRATRNAWDMCRKDLDRSWSETGPADREKALRRVLGHTMWVTAQLDTLAGVMRDKSEQGLSNARNQQLVLILVMLSAFALAFYRTTLAILGPLRRLESAMTGVEKGDLTSRAQVSTRDELGRLAAHFNQMLEEILASQDRLREVRGQLDRSLRLASLGRMAAGLAHEINTPLGSILASVDLLLDQSDPGRPDHRYLTIIRHEILRVVDIEKKMAAFAVAPERYDQAVDVGALLNEVAVQVADQATALQVTLDCRVEGYPPLVRGSVDQLRQVLLNLVTNAFSALPQGGKLELRARAAVRPPLGPMGGVSPPAPQEGAPAPSGAELEVTDTGRGISPQVLERVFEPFFTTKEVGEGMGLGLAVCYGIVESHGGLIRAQSREGVGTSFRVWLPEDPTVRAGVV